MNTCDLYFYGHFYGKYTENVAHAHAVCTRPLQIFRALEHGTTFDHEFRILKKSVLIYLLEYSPTGFHLPSKLGTVQLGVA